MSGLRAYLEAKHPHSHGWKPLVERTDGPDLEWCPDCGAIRPVPPPDEDDDTN